MARNNNTSMRRTLICNASKLHIVNRQLLTAVAASVVVVVAAVVAAAVIALIGVNFSNAASVMRCDAC